MRAVNALCLTLSRRNFTGILALSTVVILAASAQPAYAQITPSDDAYTNTASPSSNFGAKPLLDVQSASQNSYIKFDLSSLPAGLTGSSIAKATLKLYVNTVPNAGSFNVDLVNGTWDEKSITANLAPALGTTVAASIPLTGSNAKDYIVIDVTSAMQSWLNGTPNDGLALVGNSPLNATFDSKESTTQSHPPELDVMFAGGKGTITGITTASGSGLMGGGTSGTLNLSLINTCGNKQVLQWNGSSWVCATISGSGTVTSVGLSAPGSDFTVTGSPVTMSGTLGLNWTVAPTSASTANAIVKRDNTGGFSAALINASISLDTNLSSTITGFQLGGTKETFGVFGFAASPNGVGVFGRGVGFSANSSLFPPSQGTGVWGDTSSGGGTGVLATADDGFAFQGVNASLQHPTMSIFNNEGGPLFSAKSASGGYCFIDGGGSLGCSGVIAGGQLSSRIDHPLDPANRYLQHAAVESPDSKTVYDGVVHLDASGTAVVDLPSYTEALDGDFRYQLTAIGAPSPNLYVAEKIRGNRFKIMGGAPDSEVSWQVTGIRHDAYSKAHPLVVEEEKSLEERQAPGKP